MSIIAGRRRIGVMSMEIRVEKVHEFEFLIRGRHGHKGGLEVLPLLGADENGQKDTDDDRNSELGVLGDVGHVVNARKEGDHVDVA
jgi:hypothetical protein